MHNPTSKQVRLSQALQHRQPAARHTVCDRTCKIEGTPIPANNTWVSKLMPIPQVFAFATARNSVLNMPTNRLHHILQKGDKRLNQLDSFGGMQYQYQSAGDHRIGIRRCCQEYVVWLLLDIDLCCYVWTQLRNQQRTFPRRAEGDEWRSTNQCRTTSRCTTNKTQRKDIIFWTQWYIA